MTDKRPPTTEERITDKRPPTTEVLFFALFSVNVFKRKERKACALVLQKAGKKRKASHSIGHCCGPWTVDRGPLSRKHSFRLLQALRFPYV